MTEQATQFKGQISDVLAITELRGNPPDVPFFDDVDIAEITKNDPDPMYFTAAIGKVNTISSNGRFYNEEWLQELERQVKSTRPIGLFGHLAENELATKFPDEAVFWLGVRRIGEMLFAKGYCPPGAARERLRKYKGANKTIGTSIFATAEGVWNAARGATDMIASTLKLQQIDIGPADRIGVASLASVPMLTSELKTEQSEPVEVQKDTSMSDKLTIIQELTPADARLLPEPVRQAILATVTPPATPPEVGQMADLRTALGVDAATDLKAMITEMQTAQAAARKAAVTSRITELVTSGVKLEAGRAIVQEMVTDHNPQTVEEAESVFELVMKRPSVTRLLAAQVREIMGPRQGTPVAGQATKAKYFEVPSEDK